jgi:hypothetical protein
MLNLLHDCCLLRVNFIGDALFDHNPLFYHFSQAVIVVDQSLSYFDEIFLDVGNDLVKEPLVLEIID